MKIIVVKSNRGHSIAMNLDAINYFFEPADVGGTNIIFNNGKVIAIPMEFNEFVKLIEKRLDV